MHNLAFGSQAGLVEVAASVSKTIEQIDKQTEALHKQDVVLTEGKVAWALMVQQETLDALAKKESGQQLAVDSQAIKDHTQLLIG